MFRNDTTLGSAARILVVAGLAVVSLLSGRIASAGPVPDGPKVMETQQVDDRHQNLYVYSPAMDRLVKLIVLRPADTSVPRPILYLLNGAGGGVDSASWQTQTDVDTFFADKNVNVVIPIGGAFSYYTDWKSDDPALGRQKWTTFLTQELPPVLNEALGASGANAIAGVSMAGSAALALAESAPDLYKAVGAYSGCAETSTPVGRQFVRLVVETRGGASTKNMWGPVDDPAWQAADPYVNAEKLRGKFLYITSGSGLPGVHETLDNPRIDGMPIVLANQAITGGIIEAATNACTQRLADRLRELDIPATFDFRPGGTHSWGYWQDDLHNSWPGFATALGI